MAKNLTFNESDYTFHCTLKQLFVVQWIVDIGNKKSLTMDFSQIPSFIKEAAIFNTINASLTVDLSSFDTSSNIKQLILLLN